MCSLFEKNGFKVIYPEKISIKEQLKIYSDAEIIVFTEGSAIHTLQLLGNINAKVIIINRRKGVLYSKMATLL